MAPHRLHLLVGVLIWTVLGGCADSADAPSDARREDRPLQPLVYTEDPDHSPKAATARDRRLLRELVHVSDRDGSWGKLEANPGEGAAPLESPEKLGRTLYRALVRQRDAAWDHLFVPPRNYASLVRIDLEKARRFVDDKQADARPARRAFHIDKPSEAPKQGLTSIFTFEGLELGKGRKLDGDRADEEDEQVAQHWDNTLRLGLADGDVVFRVRIPKILRIHLPGSKNADRIRLGVASDLRLGPRLRVFLEAGMHLKPALLRSFDYPIPLEVGNYWRYSRRMAGTDRGSEKPSPEETSPAGQTEDQVSEKLGASGVTVRVESVDRYGTRRLVHLRFVYNDADLTRRDEFWLITPRRIFDCPRPCRRQIEDLEWLLGYLRRQTPIMQFPISRASSWGGGSGEPIFQVQDQWHEIEVPGGTFFGTLAIEGLGPLDDRVPFHRIRGATRYFAPGKGIVKRTYRIGGRDSDTIVESLVDYRIMAR
ncbi:MAG: hypothetical protein ABEN55_17495 [Bradymonadaceae bacterium]